MDGGGTDEGERRKGYVIAEQREKERGRGMV